MNSPTRRQRRSSADIRALILTAARDLFREQGFEATTTKQICERADVVEALLFTNFGSKAELFEQAMLAPVADWVGEYVESFAANDASPRERSAAFVRGLYAMAEANQGVLLDALQQRHGRETGQGDLVDSLATTLQGLRGVSNLGDFPGVDPQATTVAGLGMVLGVALLDSLILDPDGPRPDRETLLNEMEQLIYFGTTRRAEP